MFSSALGFISKFGKDDQDIDEQKVVEQHEKVYQQGQGSQMDASSIGSYVLLLLASLSRWREMRCMLHYSVHEDGRSGDWPNDSLRVTDEQCRRFAGDEELYGRWWAAAQAGRD